MINKLVNTVELIDISIPADCHIVFFFLIISKGNEKIEKYQDLRIEFESLWKKKTSAMPIVIGAIFPSTLTCSIYTTLNISI